MRRCGGGISFGKVKYASKTRAALASLADQVPTAVQGSRSLGIFISLSFKCNSNLRLKLPYYHFKLANWQILIKMIKNNFISDKYIRWK